VAISIIQPKYKTTPATPQAKANFLMLMCCMIVFVFGLIFLITIMPGMASVPTMPPMASHHKEVNNEKDDDENEKRVSSIKAENRQ
jgi:Na+-transporting methylmalonyl-CoA/oxaloacetate decarboxylase gamma subunit